MKEREKRDPSFIFLRKCIRNHIVFAFLVNDLIIISKELSHPFLLLQGGNALLQMLNQEEMCSDLET
jgi:hypothetical protein